MRNLLCLFIVSTAIFVRAADTTVLTNQVGYESIGIKNGPSSMPPTRAYR